MTTTTKTPTTAGLNGDPYKLVNLAGNINECLERLKATAGTTRGDDDEALLLAFVISTLNDLAVDTISGELRSADSLGALSMMTGNAVALGCYLAEKLGLSAEECQAVVSKVAQEVEAQLHTLAMEAATIKGMSRA